MLTVAADTSDLFDERYYSGLWESVRCLLLLFNILMLRIIKRNFYKRIPFIKIKIEQD